MNNIYIFVFITMIILMYTTIPVIKFVWKWKRQFNEYRQIRAQKIKMREMDVLSSTMKED